VDYASRSVALLHVFYADVLILALGAGTFCVAASRYLRRPWLAILTVSPGLFWILTAPIAPAHFATWSFANGMESALALLCFAAALCLYRDDDGSLLRLAAVAACLGLSVLARLDDIFLVAAFVLWILYRSRHDRRAHTLLSLSPVVLMVGAYLAYNRVAAGTFLPSSGVAKLDFSCWLNLKQVLSLFLPVITGGHPEGLRLATSPFLELNQRVLQMVIPAVFCVAELGYAFRRRHAESRFTVLHAIAAGIVLKAFYNFVLVWPISQGQWYYTVSITVSSLILVQWLDRVAERLWPGAEIGARSRWLLRMACVLWALASFNIVSQWHNLQGPVGFPGLLDDNRSLQAKLAALGADRFLEFDDGYIGFVADTPSVGALGLVLDREASEAMAHGHFFDIAYGRGYRVLVADPAYASLVNHANAGREFGKPRRMYRFQPEELERYVLAPAGDDGSGDGLSFFQLVPRASEPKS